MMFNGPSIDSGFIWYHWCLQQHLNQNVQRNGPRFYGKPQVTRVTCRLGHVCRVVYSCSTQGAQDGSLQSLRWYQAGKIGFQRLKIIGTHLRASNSELKWIFFFFLVFKMFLCIKFYEKFVFSPTRVCSFTTEYFSGLGISSLNSCSYL